MALQHVKAPLSLNNKLGILKILAVLRVKALVFWNLEVKTFLVKGLDKVNVKIWKFKLVIDF